MPLLRRAPGPRPAMARKNRFSPGVSRSKRARKNGVQGDLNVPQLHLEAAHEALEDGQRAFGLISRAPQSGPKDLFRHNWYCFPGHIAGGAVRLKVIRGGSRNALKGVGQ